MRTLVPAILLVFTLAACGGASQPKTAPAISPDTGLKIGGIAIKPLAQRGKMNLTFSPTNINALPLLLAMDKGYFDKAGIDVTFNERKTSAVGLLPQLGRGDTDMLDLVAAPGLFNQQSEGFGVKIVGALSVPKDGRAADVWMVVPKDEAGQIKDFKDLKGKTVEGVAEGTPGDVMTSEAIRLGGLTPGQDVTQTFRVKTTADYLNLTRAHAYDAMSMVEPMVTQAVQQGLVSRWKTFNDIAPWFRTSLVAVSPQLVQKNPAVAEKFLEVYLATSREIDQTNGAWTDELLATMSKHADLSTDILKAMGSVPYFDPNGGFSLDALQKTQDFWAAKGEVKQKVDVTKLFDDQLTNSALQQIGKA